MSNTYTYLKLVNEILQEANEVIFTGQTDFDNAVALHAHVKTKVNDVIKDILNREDNNWPFQLTDTSQVLTIGTEAYSSPVGAVIIDWESFYIDKVYADNNTLGTVTCDSGAKTFTATSGSFIDSGFQIGMKVQWTGLSSNSLIDVTITNLSALVMTVSESITTVSTPQTAFTVTNVYLYSDARQLYSTDINTYRNLHLTNTKNCVLTSYYTKPTFVVRTNNNNLIFGPLKPNGTYLVRYQYYTQYTPLVSYNDTLIIPDLYAATIKKGVSMYINKFRDNDEAAISDAKLFEDSINEMRRQLIPQDEFASYLV